MEEGERERNGDIWEGKEKKGGRWWVRGEDVNGSHTYTHTWSRSSLLWRGGADGEEKKSGGDKEM